MWDSISSVRREWLGAPVVALEVEDTGLYVSDGMLTHNSVPGVRGIGPKKALALLERTEFEWDALLAELGEDKAREAIMSRRLVDLRYPEFAAYGDDVIGVLTNLSAPAFAPTAAGGMLWEPLQDFLKKWSMNTVIQRLTDGTLWFTGGPTGSAEDLFASFGP